MASVGEAITRVVFESLFPGKLFPSAVNPPGFGRAQIDGWNEEECLAFEFQGIQHYETGFFGTDLARLESQQLRDAAKRNNALMCGIDLIEVPYTLENRRDVWETFNRVAEYVKGELTTMCRTYSRAPVSKEDVLRRVEYYLSPAYHRGRFRHIVEGRGGKVIRGTYINAHSEFTVMCATGHTFVTTLARIGTARRRFCPECGGTTRKSYEENQDRLRAFGYTLLDSPEGHPPYEVSRDNILVNGRRCSMCSKAEAQQRKSLATRIGRARQFGLELLDGYQPRNRENRWRCLYCQREFSASWVAILNRSIGRRCLLC
jgi:hypothetical protein